MIKVKFKVWLGQHMKVFFRIAVLIFLNLWSVSLVITGELRLGVPLLNAAPSNSQYIYVTNSNDRGRGSLRWAIESANLSPIDDLIDLSQVQGKIGLESSLPDISSNLALIGDGNDIISGNHAHRVLSIADGDVTISGLTIADGLALGQDGINGVGGSAGMGGGLFIDRGSVTLKEVIFRNNQAGGQGSDQKPPLKNRIETQKNNYQVNRGAIIGINGISLDPNHLTTDGATIDSHDERHKANRGAIAGVNGIGINGIGSIAFGGGGGFGGFGNAGNGGNGGHGGVIVGNGGDGGTGIFGSFGLWESEGGSGSVAFGGGGGYGGFGNAGNGGNGGSTGAIAKGGDGGDGGKGGFGGGGGAGEYGGQGGKVEQMGQGGFGGAIFVRAGRLLLDRTSFISNSAFAGKGKNSGQGKGGAIFLAGPDAKVLLLGKSPNFSDNFADSPANTPTDNADVYWPGERSNSEAGTRALLQQTNFVL